MDLVSVHKGGGNSNEDLFHDYSEGGTTLTPADPLVMYRYGAKEGNIDIKQALWRTARGERRKW